MFFNQVNFDSQKRRYEDDYVLVKINPWQDPVVIESDKYPSWAVALMGEENVPKQMETCAELNKGEKLRRGNER